MSRKCQTCKTTLIKETQKKFCSRSCATTYNNKMYVKRKSTGRKSTCGECKIVFDYYPYASEGKYCSNQCFHKHKRTRAVERFERGELAERPTIKLILIDRYGHKCSMCHGEEWLGEPIPLEVDHIDGNAGNNMPDNVRLLCCNCHAITPYSNGKNKGRGRKARGLPLR